MIPHDVMVGLFGLVFLLALVALGISLTRYWQAIRGGQIAARRRRARGWPLCGKR